MNEVNSSGRPDPISETARSRMTVLGTLVPWLTVLGICGVFVACLLPASRGGRQTGRRTQCKNNFKQLGLALANYESDYGSFPPAYTVDESGRRLHSWRTLLLPYLDQKPLYESIDLSKPWNDPANAQACGTNFSSICCPSVTIPKTHTTYVAVITPTSCLQPKEGRRIREITGGTSNTLLLIEVPPDMAVPWMSPEDADEAMVIGLGPTSKTGHDKGFHGLLADGSVRFFSVETLVETRRALISVLEQDKVGLKLD